MPLRIRRGKRSFVDSTRRSIRSPTDLIRPPIGSVFPTPVVPLQHDFGWGIGGVEIDITKKSVRRRIWTGVGANLERARRVVEIVLVLAAGQVRDVCRIA